jgi:hypothetical protein
LGISETVERPASADPATDGDGADLVTALLPSRSAPPADAEDRAAPEWEYRTELLEHGFMGWGKEQIDMHKLQERLDVLGEERWELVHVSWSHRVRRRHGGHLLIFKRPKG